MSVRVEEEEEEEEEEGKEEALAAWKSLIGDSKLARQACTCGLIPCLCGDAPGSGESEWVVSRPSMRRAKEEGLVLNPEEGGSRRLAASLSRVLKPHQVEGVRFLCERALDPRGGRGCILADHMGLGKTLQVISVISAYLSSRDVDEGERAKTAMVVAPAFVLPNWSAEIARWLPDDRVLRARCLPTSANRRAALEEWRRDGGTLLVGYEMYRQLVSNATDADDPVSRALCDPGPGLAVLDEAHRLKEPKSQLYRSLKRLRTRRRVLVSGYPVQNRLDEYFALVDFTRPGVLGTYDAFRTFFERPIATYVEACEDGDPGDPKLALRRAFALSDALADVVLRRGNDRLGADLPPRRDWLVHCDLSPTQAALYAAFDDYEPEAATASGELAAYHVALAIVNHPDIVHAALADEERLLRDDHESDDEQPCKRPRPADGEWRAPEIVESERRAREERRARDEARRDKLRHKLAARLVSSVAKAKPGLEDCVVLSAAGDLSRWAKPVLRPVVAPGGAATGYVVGRADGRCGSGKASVALAILAAVTARGERAILFTQTLGTLDVLERLLDHHHPAIRYRRIDGATNAAKRIAIVDRFNGVDSARRGTPNKPPHNAHDETCDVLLMSIKAGGEGINLVGASRVVLFDVCWNPCFDQQALCRAHRFGQRRPVHVYRLVGPKNTMEARVLRQQRRKELLVREVADVGARHGTATGRHFLDSVYDKHQHHTSRVDDDVLRDVVAAVGDKWIASVHECVSEDAAACGQCRELLTDDEKAAALGDYRTAFHGAL